MATSFSREEIPFAINWLCSLRRYAHHLGETKLTHAIVALDGDAYDALAPFEEILLNASLVLQAVDA